MSKKFLTLLVVAAAAGIAIVTVREYPALKREINLMRM